jgi:N6-L-threonylcarbamoyladenine synthase
LQQAVDDTGITEIALAGGVSANSGLRNAVTAASLERGWKIHIPQFSFTTDNAAMIAITGFYKFQKKAFADQDITPLARMHF